MLISREKYDNKFSYLKLFAKFLNKLRIQTRKLVMQFEFLSKLPSIKPLNETS